jgi:hypothetical protein
LKDPKRLLLLTGHNNNNNNNVLSLPATRVEVLAHNRNSLITHSLSKLSVPVDPQEDKEEIPTLVANGSDLLKLCAFS